MASSGVWPGDEVAHCRFAFLPSACARPRLSDAMPLRAAPLTFEISSSASPAICDATLGLQTKSTAPFSSACIVAAAPRSVNELSMTTGRRYCVTMCSSVVSPSMRGISRSSVTTSGLTCSILPSAKSPSIAVAITSISSSRASRFEISLRMTAESSTTSTRILFVSTRIGQLAFPLQPLEANRFAQQVVGVEDEDDLAVADQRRAADGVVVQPAVVERLNHDFLFAVKRLGEDAEALSGDCNDNHKQMIRLGAHPCARAAAPPLKIERPATTHHGDEAVAQPVALDAINVCNLGGLDACDLPDGEERQRE